MSLLTVAIPTRNRGEYLPYALESCRKQLSMRFQYLVIDNCSTDDTAEVCRKYECDSRFKYVKYDVVGNINEQFLRCLEHSDGDWLCIIGDDDCIFPDLTEVFKKSAAIAGELNLNSLAWDAPIYRWPNFSNYESNCLKYTGLNHRGDFDADHVFVRTREYATRAIFHNLKYIYQGPGVYHKACRKKVLADLCTRFSTSEIFYHSADISVAAYLWLNEAGTLHLMQPLTMSGYSARSTGAAHTVADNSDAVENYFAENPSALKDFQSNLTALVNFNESSLHLSEIGAIYMIVCRALSLYGADPLPVRLYVEGEIANAGKVAPRYRKTIGAMLSHITNNDAALAGQYDLKIFDNTDGPRSLPPFDPAERIKSFKTATNGNQLNVVSRMLDGYANGIENILDAAAYCHHRLRLGDR